MRISFNCITPTNNNQTNINKCSQVSAPSFKGIYDIPSEILIKKELNNELENEAKLEGYLAALSSPQFKSILSKNRNTKLETFNINVFSIKFPHINQINELFKNANIITVGALENFIRIFCSNQKTLKIFSGQQTEAVKIYGVLQNKTDINNFPNLLLHIFNEETEEENPNYNKLNFYTSVLKNSGVNNEKDIDEKLAYLKPEYNNFDTVTDKINAVKYLADTYDTKIALLDEILTSHPISGKNNSQSVYYTLSDIINYLFLQNDGANIDRLPNLINTALDYDKLKSAAKNEVSKVFPNLDEIENKINFLEFIQSSSVSVNELNTLTKKSVITDTTLLDILVNKKPITEQIKSKNKNEIFNNFYGILTAVYTQGKNQSDNDALDTTINIIDRYKIKNQNEFLNFYNKVNQTKERELTTNQLCEFTDLFKYYPNTDILAASKLQGVSAKELLEENKAKYLKAQPYIEDFLHKEAEDYFIDKSPLDVYKEFEYCVDFTAENASKNLNHYADLQTGVENQTQTIRQEFSKFRVYFNSKQSALEFIVQNKIKFDESEASVNYKNSCLEILNILSQEGDENYFRKCIETLSAKNVLPKSKSDLDAFVAEHKQTGDIKELLNLIIDKDIPSISSLNNFIKKYQGENGSCKNLINHFKNTPEDIDFNTYNSILNSINEIIKQTQVPTRVNNDNIQNIDIQEYTDTQNLTIQDINRLLCRILNKPDKNNFIEGLQKTYKRNTEYYSPYQIARELAYKIGTTDESYHNIVRELKLSNEDLNLPPDYNENIYIKAIKNKLPQEFINLVNSSSWMNINQDTTKLPNISLHAKLRILDRIALREEGSLADINKQETKEKLKNILKSIYTSEPSIIKGREETNRILLQTPSDIGTIESIFSKRGELITVFPLY